MARFIAGILHALTGSGDEKALAFLYYLQAVVTDGDYLNDFLTYAGSPALADRWEVLGRLLAALVGS